MSDSKPRRTPTFWTPLVFSPDVAVVVVTLAHSQVKHLKLLGNGVAAIQNTIDLINLKTAHNVRQKYKGKCYWLDIVELKCHEEYLYSC